MRRRRQVEVIEAPAVERPSLLIVHRSFGWPKKDGSGVRHFIAGERVLETDPTVAEVIGRGLGQAFGREPT